MKTACVAAAGLILIGTLLLACAEPRGKKIFLRERCIVCHSIDTTGGVGPDLSRVGGRRSRAYIIQQIRDPQSHNPDTRMPSFRYLPEQDINDLADYLAGLN